MAISHLSPISFIAHLSLLDIPLSPRPLECPFLVSKACTQFGLFEELDPKVDPPIAFLSYAFLLPYPLVAAQSVLEKHQKLLVRCSVSQHVAALRWRKSAKFLLGPPSHPADRSVSPYITILLTRPRFWNAAPHCLTPGLEALG